MTIPSLMYASDRQQNLRVVHREPGLVYLMPIGAKGVWTFTKSTDHVLEMLSTKRWLDLTSDCHAPSRLTDTVETGQSSIYARSIGDQRFARFSQALSDTRSLLTKEGRGHVYKEMKAIDQHLSKETFYTVVRDWLEGGATPASLDARRNRHSKALDTSNIMSLDLSECRLQTQSKARELQLLGAPDAVAKKETATGKIRKRASPFLPSRFVVDRPCLRLFKHYYKQKFAIPSPSIESVYNKMLAEVFSTPQPFGPPIQWPHWCLPSLSRFRDYWVKMHSFEERQIAQGGGHDFKLNKRGLLGQQVTEAFAAGRVAQIDATVWAVNLVGEEPGAPLIGPPVVFRLRCKDTGQLLGISVSLESASFNSAAMCIANALEDKEEFCRSHGVDIKGLPWDVRGLPSEIVADQGETYNDKPIAFCRFTGVAITNLPRARGDAKGGVESDFNVIHTGLVDITPSAIIARYESENNVKWHLRGSMTLKQFMGVLLLQELQKMHKPRRGVRRTQCMRRQGVDSSSSAMFQWGMRHGGGMLRTFDPTLVRLSLLPREKAAVDERGIVFRGIVYSCAQLELSQASSKARVKGVEKTIVAYDPLRVNNIWLIVGDCNAPDKYVLCAVDERFIAQVNIGDKTWREVRTDIQDESRVNAIAASTVAASLARAKAEQRRIVRESEEWTSAQRREFPRTETALLNQMPAARLRAKNKTSPPMALTASIALPTISDSDARSTAPSSAVVYQLPVSKSIRQTATDIAHTEIEAPRPASTTNTNAAPKKPSSRFMALLNVCQPEQADSATGRS